MYVIYVLKIKNNGISESESQFESLIQSGSSQSAKKKVVSITSYNDLIS